MPRIGMIHQPTLPPETLTDLARRAETAGVEEVWVWEDCFKQSGLAPLIAALASTERLRVGVGILPMPLRNPALAAMEIATVERLYPGRAIFGFGHGVLDWMGQAGARVASPLTLMREYVPALRRLLAGEEVTTAGRYVRLDRVKLAWPPERTVPVLAAGEGPKTLSLTGEVADGTVLTAGSSPAMVRSAASRIHAAREAAGRTGPHEIVVFLMCAFGDTASALEAEFDAWGFSGERRFAASGDDAAVAEAIAALTDAGATSVILQPLAHDADLAPYADATARVTAIVRAAEPPRP